MTHCDEETCKAPQAWENTGEQQNGLVETAIYVVIPIVILIVRENPHLGIGPKILPCLKLTKAAIHSDLPLGFPVMNFRFLIGFWYGINITTYCQLQPEHPPNPEPETESSSSASPERSTWLISRLESQRNCLQ